MHIRVKLFQICVKLEICQSRWKKIKTNSDCLYSLTTITAKFNFAFFSEPCLILYKLSLNGNAGIYGNLTPVEKKYQKISMLEKIVESYISHYIV